MSICLSSMFRLSAILASGPVEGSLITAELELLKMFEEILLFKSISKLEIKSSTTSNIENEPFWF